MRQSTKHPGKYSLIKELVDDWHKGVISANVAMMALSLIVHPQPPPSKKVIAYAKRLMRQDKFFGAYFTANKQGVNV